MTRIDVAHGASHRLQVAANTVVKQYRNGQAVWVYCTDPKRLEAFSRLLWSIEDIEFVPHQVIQEGVGACLVQVCQDDPSQYLTQWELSSERSKNPILLNLDLQCPPNFTAFERILEVVSTHPTDQEYARQRMQQYRQAGIKPVFHQLTA